MLKCDAKDHWDDARFHLVYEKRINILITNVCNLSCGGCHQHCGQIPKDKLFFMSLVDLQWVIEWVIGHTPHKSTGIFGGEPTVHPQFSEILDLLRQYQGQMDFLVFTNGRVATTNEANIFYEVNLKDDPNRAWEPTLVAPLDIIGNPDKASYWELAKKNCYMWQNCLCIIKGRRAYACEVFAAYDTLTGEDHGWELKWGENAFSKPEAEIREQASHFCYRCGWCLPRELKRKYDQRVGQQSLVTISNLKLPLKQGGIQVDLPLA